MDDNERDLVVSTTRQLLLSTELAALPAALRSSGWFDLVEADPELAVGTLFELQGEELAASPMLDELMAAPLPGPIILALPGRSGAPAGEWRSDGIEVAGLMTTTPIATGAVLVPAVRNGGVVLGSAPATTLSVEPIEGVDPWAGWNRVAGLVAVSAFRPKSEDPRDWETALVTGRRALAHELIGLTRRMLRLAVAHAAGRHQFGRPIGSFQAVQHRLADVHVGLEVAQLATVEAWSTPDLQTATMAKLLAGSAARLAAKQCQQVLGGMGFTWEHPLHRYIRRSIALDWLLGSAVELAEEVGDRLLRTGCAPQLVNL